MADITGKVVWRSDPNQGEGGLRVEIWENKPNALAPLGFAVTEDNGRFVIPDIWPAPVRRGRGSQPQAPLVAVQQTAQPAAAQAAVVDYEFAVVRNGEEITFVPIRRWSQKDLVNDITLMVAPPKPDTLSSSLRDLAAYNPTAYEVNGSGSYGDGHDRTSMDRIIENAMTDVLGLRLKYDKPSMVIDALGQVFNIDENNGSRSIRYTPRSFVIETELGAAITGAQAVLYRYFHQTVDSILKSLSGLRAIGSTVDAEKAKAATEILRDTLQQLLGEVGRSGGPREVRINPLFARMNAQMRTLKTQYKLQTADVTIISEEQVLTDFLIIEDQIAAMEASWYRFLNNPSAYLGTGFAELATSLGCISEGVQEVFKAMRAFGITAKERQSIVLVKVTVPNGPKPAKNTSLTIEDLMSWANDFAVEVVPDAIQGGGKSGAKSVIGEAMRLRGVLKNAKDAPATSHPAIRQPRVQSALAELIGHLDTVIADLKAF